MKKVLTLIIFSILLIYSLSNLIYFPGFKVYAFDDLGLIQKEKITSINIRNTKGEEVHLTDRSMIEKVLNDFSIMELSKRKRESDTNNTDVKDNNGTPKYFIELENNGNLVEIIYLSGNKYLKIIGYSTNETIIYEIVNHPELEIDNIFKSALK
ncbi:hypothetical protein [Brevibacillus reuszeri]|uniref:hypothetical protein n=1 Tax=Brevibacillus reuszeri TaxID=54915 RepID=UPI000CCC442B|nr:hypothetical protein [Brevibacillus reuszeri]